MRPWMNVDAGELDSEPEALWALADALNIACGGHAGDARSMERVLRACAAHGVRAGAHPSYPDRAGFGRRALQLAPEALEATIAAQCRALVAVAERVGVAIEHAKLHGALYHDAAREPAIAAACVRAVRAELGAVALVGPAGSALEREARAAGSPFEREAFADRGRRADGTLVPRGEPGALIEDPARAAAEARALAASGVIDTLCVHGDTPGALAIARAVREALDALGRAAIALEPLGERALRFAIPEGLDRAALVAALRALPGVRDASVSESHACVCFDRSPPPGLARVLARAPRPRRAPRIHVVRAAYDGPDLDEAAALAGLDREALIARHLAATYVVSFVGFLPGFGYLRGLDPALARIPRRDAPRPRVPAGAIAIAGGFTSIYPQSSPGGWRLLGRAVGFQPLEGNHVRLSIGDQVRFERVG